MVTAHMNADRTQWSALAATLLEITHLQAPVEADELAALCGLNLVRRPGPGMELVGTELRYDASAEGAQRQRLLLEGVSRWALRSCLISESDLAIHCVVRGLSAGRRAEGATARTP
jgi:hypothetical protein